MLKEKGELTLYIERNLFEDFCRDGEFHLLTGICIHLVATSSIMEITIIHKISPRKNTKPGLSYHLFNHSGTNNTTSLAL